MRIHALLAPFVALVLLGACSGGAPEGRAPATAQETPSRPSQETPAVTPAPNDPAPAAAPSSATPPASRTETATFAGGCFWCVEAVLERIPGVIDARSGYMGGTTKDPTYEEICRGDTGHAEVVQVTFDPSKVTYESLLEWFWKSHDPTTLNRQGADVGTQYRSAIFVTGDAQRRAAERSKAAAQERFEDPIVTEITAAGPFTAAEDHHQDFYRLNKTYPYCRAVIEPKMKKLGLGD